MKRIIAILTAAVMLLSFAACGETKKPDNNPTTDAATQDADVQTTDSTQTQAPETQTTADGETVTADPTTAETTTAPADPSTWTKEQIIEYYKAAAGNSKNATSKKTMEMKELVVNGGDGFLATFVEMVTPVFKAALKNNSTEFTGITGGYEKLVPTDVKTAKAYKSGNYTVIEMTMVEQVDGIHGSEKEGTVGHAISVVGDIPTILKENLPMFDIYYENSDIKIRYANPEVKVKINNTTGKIEKGTWSYDVQVNLKNLFIQNNRIEFFKADVKSGHGSVAFNVTVGGGF